MDAEDTPEDGHRAGQSVADESSSLILQSLKSAKNWNAESSAPRTYERFEDEGPSSSLGGERSTAHA